LVVIETPEERRYGPVVPFQGVRRALLAIPAAGSEVEPHTLLGL
jgi:hypothetical protein